MGIRNEKIELIKNIVVADSKNQRGFEDRFEVLFNELLKQNVSLEISERIEFISISPVIIKFKLKCQNFSKEYIFSDKDSAEIAFFRGKVVSKKVFHLDYFDIYWEQNKTEPKGTPRNYTKTRKGPLITKKQKNFLFRLKGEDPRKFKTNFQGNISELTKLEASKLLKKLGYD